MAKLSIILTSRDRYELLRHAVTSVLEQTYRDWELIIVDDESKDKRIRDYLLKLKTADSRVQVCFAKPVNAGYRKHQKMVAVRINQGLAISRGRYISYLCDDNVWYPDRCKRMAEALDGDPRIALVIDQCRFVMPDGRVVPQNTYRYNYRVPHEKGHEQLLKEISPSTFIVHDCVMHRRVRRCCRGDWPIDLKNKTPVDWRFWLYLHREEKYRIRKLEDVGTVAYFPGTWKHMTIEQALPLRQELTRRTDMARRRNAMLKRKKSKKEKPERRRVKNTSGKNQQFTRPNGKPYKVGIGEIVWEDELLPDGGRLPPGFSYEARLIQKPLKEVLEEKPEPPKEYGYETIGEPAPKPKAKPKKKKKVTVVDKTPEPKVSLPVAKAPDKKKTPFDVPVAKKPKVTKRKPAKKKTTAKKDKVKAVIGECSVCGKKISKISKTGLCREHYYASFTK